MKIFLLFLLGLFSISAFGQKTAASDVTVYHDPQFGFSVSYPKSWIPDAKSSDAVRLNVTADSDQEFASANLNVTKYTGSENYSPADYVSLMLDKNYTLLQKTAAGSLTNGKLISSGRISFGGRAGYYLIIEGTAGEGESTIDLKTYSVQMLTGGYIYTLTCGAGAGTFEKYYPQFQAVAASFKFDTVQKK